MTGREKSQKRVISPSHGSDPGKKKKHRGGGYKKNENRHNSPRPKKPKKGMDLKKGVFSQTKKRKKREEKLAQTSSPGMRIG